MGGYDTSQNFVNAGMTECVGTQYPEGYLRHFITSNDGYDLTYHSSLRTAEHVRTVETSGVSRLEIQANVLVWGCFFAQNRVVYPTNPSWWIPITTSVHETLSNISWLLSGDDWRTVCFTQKERIRPVPVTSTFDKMSLSADLFTRM